MYIEDENIASQANFLKLREECYSISRRFIPEVPQYRYPNIHILGDEYKKDIQSQPVEKYARIEWENNNKITFIKFLRERFETMGLLEAKMMADGFWQRFDEQKKQKR